MTHIAFINTQAFGDSVLGINAARRLKENNPDFLISYSYLNRFNLTTNDGANGLFEALEVLEHQPWIDAVGVAQTDNTGRITGLNLNDQSEDFKKVDDVIFHDRWFSDLGISRSQNVPIKKYLTEEQFLDGNLELFVESEKIKDDTLRIATHGPLDWNRKLMNESLRLDVMFGLKEICDNRNITYEIDMFGVDIGNYSLYTALNILNRNDIFIGPAGSLTHSATALGLDTITIPSVFPVEYDLPEFYSTNKGTHISVRHRAENHCGDFKCVSKKEHDAEDKRPNNPPTEWGFWLKACPHTDSKLACTKMVQSKDILDSFERLLDVRSK